MWRDVSRYGNWILLAMFVAYGVATMLGFGGSIQMSTKVIAAAIGATLAAVNICSAAVERA